MDQVDRDITVAQSWMLDKWPTRQDHPRWSQAHGLAVYAKLRTPASQNGWILSVGGTTIANADGQDLDIFALNWRENASKLFLIKDIKTICKARLVDLYHGAFGTGVGFCTEDGFLIDLNIRLQPIRAEEV